MKTNEQNRLNWWDKIMMAITFAEANEADSAREILDTPKQKRPEGRIGKQRESRPELRV